VAISPEGFSLTNWQQYSRFTKWLLAHPLLFKIWLNGLEILTSISDGAAPLAKKQAYWNFFNEFPTTSKLFFQRSIKTIRSELVGDRLDRLKIPILFLQSDYDDRSTIESSQFYAKSVQKSEYRSIKDPASVQESALQFGWEIRDFIDRVETQIDREEVELW
jgi:pimeloyl-ACP methyl ester carboxylesterase